MNRAKRIFTTWVVATMLLAMVAVPASASRAFQVDWVRPIHIMCDPGTCPCPGC